MSSTNYHIYADSINTGGTLSTGGSYSIEDSLGETPSTGTSTGGVYQINGGYQYMILGYLTLSIGSNSVNLANLGPNSISMATNTIVVDTNSGTGYTLSVDNVTGSILNNVADGVVSAGADEYGVNTSGGDGVLVADMAVVHGLVLASTTTTPASARSTDLVFKASTGAAPTVANYSQTITLSASANY